MRSRAAIRRRVRGCWQNREGRSRILVSCRVGWLVGVRVVRYAGARTALWGNVEVVGVLNSAYRKEGAIEE